MKPSPFAYLVDRTTPPALPPTDVFPLIVYRDKAYLAYLANAVLALR